MLRDKKGKQEGKKKKKKKGKLSCHWLKPVLAWLNNLEEGTKLDWKGMGGNWRETEGLSNLDLSKVLT